MRRLVVLAIAVACGLIVGIAVAVTRPATEAPTAAPASTGAGEAPAAAANASGGSGLAASTSVPIPGPASTRPSPPSAPVLLAWMPSPVTTVAVDGLRADPVTAALTAVRRDDIGLVEVADKTGRRLDIPAGFEVPTDVMAYDAATYASFVPPVSAAAFDALRAGEALLGTSAAQVRGVGVGATLTFRGGTKVTVTGIVDDEIVGAAEVMVDLATGAKLGVDKIRYVLLSYRGTRAEAEAAVTRIVPGPIRFRGPGETPFLRNADAVLPLVKVKLLFGEFPFRSTPAGLEQLATWTNTYIVDGDLPVIGHVRCHRGVMDALRRAMSQLQQEQLGYLVDPAMSEVCWRLGRIHDEARLTRQAWGIGLQLNNAENPTGSGSAQDRRLIEIMQAHGFTWGGDWLIAEPSYFEYVALR